MEGPGDTKKGFEAVLGRVRAGGGKMMEGEYKKQLVSSLLREEK